MPIRFGKCTNFGNCVKADSEALIEIPENAKSECPECHRELSAVNGGRRQSNWLFGILAVAAILVILAVIVIFSHTKKSPVAPTLVSTNMPTPSPATNITEPTNKSVSTNSLAYHPKDVVFVISLSATVGKNFLPDLPALLNPDEGMAETNFPKTSFGLWGFSNRSTDSGKQYRNQCFTPKLVNRPDFLQTLEQVQSNTENTWGDDSLAAVSECLDKTAWNPAAKRLVILITDSSSPTNSLSAADVRFKADLAHAKIIVLHVLNQHVLEDQPLAKSQYEVLANNSWLKDEKDYYQITGSLDGVIGTSFRANYKNTLEQLLPEFQSN